MADTKQVMQQALEALLKCREWLYTERAIRHYGPNFMGEVEAAIASLQSALQQQETRETALRMAGAAGAGQVVKQPVITRYTIDGDPRRLGSDDIHIERAKQLEGPAKWAIRRLGECLNKQGEWEYEPMPSSRDDEFLARCRFDTPEQAFAALGVQEVDRG